MQAGNPDGWHGVVEASDVVRLNLDALAACREAAAKAKKEQRLYDHRAGAVGGVSETTILATPKRDFGSPYDSMAYTSLNLAKSLTLKRQRK